MMDTGKTYYDSEDNECSIWQMVHREPHWAANRIQEGEKAIAALEALRREKELMTHKLITCGVAASHPDAELSNRTPYGDKWDSPQAQQVRALRRENEALRQERDQQPEKDTALYLLGNTLSTLLQEDDWNLVEPYLRSAEKAWGEMQKESGHFHRRLCEVTNDRDQAEARAEKAERKEVERLNRDVVNLNDRLRSQANGLRHIHYKECARHCVGIVKQHEETCGNDDDIVCRGQNCCTIIIAAIRKEHGMEEGT